MARLAALSTGGGGPRADMTAIEGAGRVDCLRLAAGPGGARSPSLVSRGVREPTGGGGGWKMDLLRCWFTEGPEAAVPSKDGMWKPREHAEHPGDGCGLNGAAIPAPRRPLRTASMLAHRSKQTMLER